MTPGGPVCCVLGSITPVSIVRHILYYNGAYFSSRERGADGVEGLELGRIRVLSFLSSGKVIVLNVTNSGNYRNEAKERETDKSGE